MRVNQAKTILSDPKQKAEYDKALERHNITDGLELDPQFTERIEKRKTERIAELKAPEVSSFAEPAEPAELAEPSQNMIEAESLKLAEKLQKEEEEILA